MGLACDAYCARVQTKRMLEKMMAAPQMVRIDEENGACDSPVMQPCACIFPRALIIASLRLLCVAAIAASDVPAALLEALQGYQDPLLVSVHACHPRLLAAVIQCAWS